MSYFTVTGEYDSIFVVDLMSTTFLKFQYNTLANNVTRFFISYKLLHLTLTIIM